MRSTGLLSVLVLTTILPLGASTIVDFTNSGWYSNQPGTDRPDPIIILPPAILMETYSRISLISISRIWSEQ